MCRHEREREREGEMDADREKLFQKFISIA
jgi:hypothetical protein